jgi:hypothetical protein
MVPITGIVSVTNKLAQEIGYQVTASLTVSLLSGIGRWQGEYIGNNDLQIFESQKVVNVSKKIDNTALIDFITDFYSEIDGPG